MFKEKIILRIPGPTPIPPRVQQAMNRPMIGHRSGQFSQMLSDVAEKIKPAFGTAQQVYVIAGSGTSALEMSVVNTLQAGDEAIVTISGAFGERFAKICERYQIKVHRLEVAWGEAITPELLQDFLVQHPMAKAVFATYCETSSGVLNPIPELSKVVKKHSNALFIVDAVSCLGAVPCEMDEWGLDIVVTGSQKAFMLPTGLAFIAVSQQAWKRIEQITPQAFYLDLKAYRKSMADQTTPYTPAVSLVFGLEEVVAMLDEEGLPQVFARHELMKNMTRAAMRALGLPLMTEDEYASPTVTSVDPGDLFDAEELRKILRTKYNVVIAGGQQHLKGRIFRIGHMGYCDPQDVLTVISLIEVSLQQIGYEITLGAGVRAAQEVLIQHG
ncbi:pyridoxal-phosphate-dependent aminotransferase family protein [Brevibacillus laterosporus]|uniref:L-aspartate/phosphoserine aminotransferase apoenzyme n=1 Tax=Brevibacillus laterosporus LMG 15441 TaxID=1042163 RepID=A0A075R0Q9_BRELA|nr:alanine--glyoxylate aminotransferase family protein [Brevibacillus laterosporus]AIG26177.1 L-aspartate/phosphoserine aminotransferase apoenzyme [Brevibacillus laterosporus LMG 15441]AYK07677.1 alanine--glyoxylate aminotransferase family protein [Brevibacillus laterosporus]MDF9411655.1 alanine--glyoxylate aminotransferase family protein [Brevibacillus laterosporus]RJL12487.1 alanine--glyoxylate aminotransferase family protein [Brevibacillus laterosporus]TPH07312.1 alanine--glyoxylate aminotr